MPTLNEALGAAYHREAAGDRAGAAAVLRDPVAADRAAAMQRRAELGQIVTARTQGQRCHAHIEKVQCDLLDEVLGETPNA